MYILPYVGYFALAKPLQPNTVKGYRRLKKVKFFAKPLLSAGFIFEKTLIYYLLK